MLVHWEGQSEDDATWVDEVHFCAQFPEFYFEDKTIFKQQGIDRDILYKRRIRQGQS